jgi:hypothetical protein
LTSREALGLILFLVTRPTPFKEVALEEIGTICYRNCYQGKWMLVHHFLKMANLELIVYHIFERNIPLRDVFGNWMKIGRDRFQMLKFRIKKNRSKIRYPQRKRGYHDHGSMRPAHKNRLNEPTRECNDRLDLRSLYVKSLSVLNFLYA